MRFIDLKLFLLLFACVAGALVYESPVRFRTLVETGDPWDVAIVGQGYFQVTDEDLGNTCYTRTGKLQIGQNGFLCLIVGGKEWPIEPRINYWKPGWTAFRILGDGNVSIHEQEKNSTTLIGQFIIATFTSQSAFSDNFAVNNSSDHTGQPTISTAGNSNVILQQGWLEQPAESSAYRFAKPIIIGSVIAFVLKVLLDAILTQQKLRQFLHATQSPVELE